MTIVVFLLRTKQHTKQTHYAKILYKINNTLTQQNQ